MSPRTRPVVKNMIGAYGPWAAQLCNTRPGLLSFRRAEFKSLAAWRRRAVGKALELVAPPDEKRNPRARVRKQYTFDGLHVEELVWQLPYGPPTDAVFIRPADAKGRLPGVLALHDHAGNKYFGLRKITRTGGQHPNMAAHQAGYYGGAAWANEIARRGYAVLVHDAFLFASRRVRYADVSDVLVGDRREVNPEDPAEINVYNTWASGHENIMARSLFCSGITWPGVFFYEDRCALDVLASRPDVDPARLACGGLSGGGLRTVFLAGLDHRIRVAFAVGFMSTWNDFLLNKCHTHTWMAYVPLLPLFLDFPEILGLRVPLPTYVLNTNEDQLYTLPEMHKADAILRRIYTKAGSADRYRCSFYPGPHKFDLPMQADAFDWLDGWLK